MLYASKMYWKECERYHINTLAALKNSAVVQAHAMNALVSIPSHCDASSGRVSEKRLVQPALTLTNESSDMAHRTSAVMSD